MDCWLLGHGWKLLSPMIALLIAEPLRDTLFGARSRKRTFEFEELLSGNRDQLFGMAYRLTGNRDDAQDLLQETVLDALRTFKPFECRTHFDRWMKRILTNNFIDWYRRRPKFRIGSLTESFPEGEDEPGSDPPDRTHDPARLLNMRILEEPVQAALDALVPEQRLAVVLCDLEGFSYLEIAALTRTPLGTVRTRIKRGRDRLRQSLAEYARDRYRL